MFLLTPPSPSRTKIYQRTVNEAALQSHTAGHRSSNQSYFDAGNPPKLHNDPSLAMTTPHRGLEHGLPPGMILPDPLRQPPSQHSAHNSASNPPPPPPPPIPPSHSPSYEPEDRTTRSWRAYSKSDEDKRRLEEEKRRQEELRVRQEELRLDQRKTEERMLRESISSGIHPNLVPLIFVGLGAGNVAGSGFEMAQQYIRQFQLVGQQVHNTLQNASPDVHRDLRTAGSSPYGVVQPQQQQTPAYTSHSSHPSQGQGIIAPAQQAANVYPSPAYQSPQHPAGSSVAGPVVYSGVAASTVPLANQAPLPRLTTNEAQVSYAPAPSLPTQNHSTGSISTPGKTQDQNTSSPSIYFHHWQPPAASTASGRDSQKVSPKTTNNQSNSSNPSPKKRKAQDAHQPAPPPSSAAHGLVSRSSSVSSRRGDHAGGDTNGNEPADLTDVNDSSHRRRSKSREATKAPLRKESTQEHLTQSEAPSSKDSESVPNS